ncbi:MAG: ankyrin repeat domain-containing protein [Mucilaginibacter sp.]
MDLFELISNNDLEGLKKALAADPALANEGVALPDNQAKGHPLHRICDAVFAGKITEEQAIEIAKIFLESGSDINGFIERGDNNTPLIAAASLDVEKLGIFYIEQGANVHYAPKSDGATALHWAAFCGKDKLVKELTESGANINQLETAYKSSPTGWAIHALTTEDTKLLNQLECVKLLLKAGADKNLLGADSIKYLQNTAKNDPELQALI